VLHCTRLIGGVQGHSLRPEAVGEPLGGEAGVVVEIDDAIVVEVGGQGNGGFEETDAVTGEIRCCLRDRG
jgi:hypothetical protein